MRKAFMKYEKPEVIIYDEKIIEDIVFFAGHAN